MARMSFDPRTYSTLADLRAGRWYLPASEEVAARHDEVARLLREFNALGNTEPARPRTAPEHAGQPARARDVRPAS